VDKQLTLATQAVEIPVKEMRVGRINLEVPVWDIQAFKVRWIRGMQTVG
jgi:hypothetical protein